MVPPHTETPLIMKRREARTRATMRMDPEGVMLSGRQTQKDTLCDFINGKLSEEVSVETESGLAVVRGCRGGGGDC